MKHLNDVFDSVKQVSIIAQKKKEIPLPTLMCKVTEEAGELAAEVLRLVGHKKSKQTKEVTIKKIKSEGVDVMLALFDVLNNVDITKEEILKLSTKAINKWKRKHIKPTTIKK